MKNSLASIFSERLKSVRGNKTQSEIALLLGMKQQMYARYESGVTMPSAEVIRKICDVTGESADFLLGLSNISKTALGEKTGGVLKVSEKAKERKEA